MSNKQKSSCINFRRDKTHHKSRTESLFHQLKTYFAFFALEKENNRLHTVFLQQQKACLQQQNHLLFCMETGGGCWGRECFVIKNPPKISGCCLTSRPIKDSRNAMDFDSLWMRLYTSDCYHMKGLHFIFYRKLPQHPLNRLNPETMVALFILLHQ